MLRIFSFTGLKRFKLLFFLLSILDIHILIKLWVPIYWHYFDIDYALKLEIEATWALIQPTLCLREVFLYYIQEIEKQVSIRNTSKENLILPIVTCKNAFALGLRDPEQCFSVSGDI